MAGIVIDFGSTNSGAAIVTDGGIITPIYDNRGYPKEPTAFYIKKNFFDLNNPYTIDLAQIKVYSCKQGCLADCNIVWTQDALNNFSDNYKNDGNWIYFERFKMSLYDNKTTVNNHDLDKVIAFFLLSIKSDVIAYLSSTLGRNVNIEDYNWVVTIPSIWSEEHKYRVLNIARHTLSEKTQSFLEPDAALLGLLHTSAGLNPTGRVNLTDGYVSYIIDSGGGTIDTTIIKEVRTDLYSYIDTLTSQEGIPTGGNIIDDAFWRFVAKLMIRDTRYTDELGLVDSLFSDFKHHDPRTWNKMVQSWIEIKHRKTTNIQDTEFEFPSKYIRWLNSTDYHEITVKLKGVENIINLNGDELKEQVFIPTFSKIVKKTKDLAIQSPSTINRVVLAGGLSTHPLLVKMLTESLKEELQYEFEIVNPKDSKYAGGAIMYGACYQLYKPIIIRKIAKRNYYFSATVKETERDSLLNGFYPQFTKEQMISYINARQKDEDIIIKNDNLYRRILVPIIKKGLLMNNYKQKCTVGSDIGFKLTIYSTEEELALFPSESNLRAEGTIECYTGSLQQKEVTAEVLFNNTQLQEGVIEFCIKDSEGTIIEHSILNDVYELN